MPQEKVTETINVDLDKLIAKGKNAVKRANLLVGLGLNSLEKCDETDLTVKTGGILTHYIFPQEIPDADFEHLKTQYAELILRNGLRELIEYIDMFYGHIYHVCLLTLRIKGCIESEGDEKITVRELGVIPSEAIFKNAKSFRDKMKILRRKFNISTSKDDFLKSLNTLRHIHSHYDGVVPERYTDDTGQFTVTWLGMNPSIQEPDGTKHIISSQMQEPIFLKNGGNVVIQFADREKTFRVEEFARISKEEFVEIGFAADRAIEEYRPKIADFMGRYGVRFIERESLVDAHSMQDINLNQSFKAARQKPV